MKGRQQGHAAGVRGRGEGRNSRAPGRWFRNLSIIAALYLVVAVFAAIGMTRVLHARSAASPLSTAAGIAGGPEPGPAKYLVLMVLDGARPDYLNITTLPHLDALRDAGTQYTSAIDGILEAETPAGHATIATGSRPDRSGILGFDWANDNDRYSLFDPAKMTDLEQILQDNHDSTIAGLYKAKHPGAVAVALSGHKYYAAAPLGGPDADAIIYYQGSPQGHYVPVAVPGHVPPAGILDDPSLSLPSTHLPDGAEDHLATHMALKVASTMHPRLLLINYPEFDWPVGHVDGGSLDPAAVTTLMTGYDTDLGRIEALYRKEGILDQTLFVVTADHGMMPISHFVPSTLISNAISQAGTTAPDIASNSGDFIWLADPAKAQAVATNIMNVHDTGIQEAYYLTTNGGTAHYLPADGTGPGGGMEQTNQFLLGALLNGHEPQVVVFGNEGASFSDPKSGWKADHGGNSWDSQHIPLVFSGPGIKAGQTISDPAQLDDIAPTVLTAMGVTPTGMEGHVLTDALLNPSTADAKVRGTEIGQLAPLTSALDDQDQQQAGG